MFFLQYFPRMVIGKYLGAIACKKAWLEHIPGTPGPSCLYSSFLAFLDQRHNCKCSVSDKKCQVRAIFEENKYLNFRVTFPVLQLIPSHLLVDTSTDHKINSLEIVSNNWSSGRHWANYKVGDIFIPFYWRLNYSKEILDRDRFHGNLWPFWLKWKRILETEVPQGRSARQLSKCVFSFCINLIIWPPVNLDSAASIWNVYIIFCDSRSRESIKDIENLSRLV